MTESTEIMQKIDATNSRDNKIIVLTAAGWTKSAIARELGIHRVTVANVVNSDWGQRYLLELYESTDHALQNNLVELVGLSAQSLKEVFEGKHSTERSKVLIDAAKLVFGVTAKFKEFEWKRVNQIHSVETRSTTQSAL